jgi:hypothetical protein
MKPSSVSTSSATAMHGRCSRPLHARPTVSGSRLASPTSHCATPCWSRSSSPRSMSCRAAGPRQRSRLGIWRCSPSATAIPPDCGRRHQGWARPRAAGPLRVRHDRRRRGCGRRAPRCAPEGSLLPAVDAASSHRAPRRAVQRGRADQRRLRRGDVAEAMRRTPDEFADRFCLAGTPEEVAERIRADILPAGFEHVSLALSDAEIPRAWAGTDIPGRRTISQQVQLIADRLLSLLPA